MKRALAFAPAAVWALLILWLGSIPSLAAPSLPGLDKVGHFGAFAVLGVLLGLGMRVAAPRASLAWALVPGVLLGAADELHQRGVAGRSSDPFDWLADVAGVALALWLTRIVLDRRAERRSANPNQEQRA